MEESSDAIDRPFGTHPPVTINYVFRGPHHRRRLLISAVFVVACGVLVIGWGGGDSATAQALGVPPAPTVTPGAGSLTASWAPSSGVPPSSAAEVRTYPRSVSCAPSGDYSCRLRVDDATPWTVSVRERIGSSWTAWSPRSSPVPHVSIVVVAGQSNATGWESEAIDAATGKNLLTQSPSPADRAIPISWDQPQTTKPARVGFDDSGPVPLLTPQILDDGQSSGPQGQQIFGPEVTLARGLYSAGVRDAVILKVTKGGTRLGDNGPWSPPSGALYSTLLTDARDLQTWEASKGRSATIATINWYQGESDSTPVLAPSYQRNLTNLITSMRTDLGAQTTTPFVIVKTSIAAYIDVQQRTGVCSPSQCAALHVADNEVRAADDAVASKLPAVALVDSILLPRIGVLLHLSNHGELLLGTALVTPNRAGL